MARPAGISWRDCAVDRGPSYNALPIKWNRRAVPFDRKPRLVFLPGQRLLAQLAERDPRGQRLGIGLHMDDGGLAGRHRALEGGGEIGRLLDRLAVAAEGAGVGREVGGPELGAVHARRELALLVHA